MTRDSKVSSNDHCPRCGSARVCYFAVYLQDEEGNDTDKKGPGCWACLDCWNKWPLSVLGPGGFDFEPGEP